MLPDVRCCTDSDYSAVAASAPLDACCEMIAHLFFTSAPSLTSITFTTSHFHADLSFYSGDRNLVSGDDNVLEVSRDGEGAVQDVTWKAMSREVMAAMEQTAGGNLTWKEKLERNIRRRGLADGYGYLAQFGNTLDTSSDSETLVGAA